MPHALEELERAHKALVAAGRTAFTLRMRRDVERPGQSRAGARRAGHSG